MKTLELVRSSFVVGAPALALLTSVACTKSSGMQPASGKAQPVGASPGGLAEHCGAWTTFTDGPYKYENNVWGSKKAKGSFAQCLLSREVAGATQYGWKWSWPGFDPTVFAYPEVIVGWKPWSGGEPTDDRFPVRVADIRELTLSYAVETQAQGSYNLAPEIWLVEPGTKWSKTPNPLAITAEVMFWMDYQSGARPAGRIISTPVLDGVTYELWKEDSIGDKGDGRGWVLFSFKSPKIQHSGTVSIHTLLKHLVEGNHVSADDQVASVEFGNEVMGGSGTTWVERFEVSLSP